MFRACPAGRDLWKVISAYKHDALLLKGQRGPPPPLVFKEGLRGPAHIPVVIKLDKSIFLMSVER